MRVDYNWLYADFRSPEKLLAIVDQSLFNTAIHETSKAPYALVFFIARFRAAANYTTRATKYDLDEIASGLTQSCEINQMK